jgi:SAM-dependent methyltransferase
MPAPLYLIGTVMTRHSDEAIVGAAVEAYYTDKIRSHGATPRGVDWRDGLSQRLRLCQLSVMWRDARDFSVGDLGCGYGALLGLMRATRTPFREFHGIGSPVMIDAAAVAGGTSRARRDRELNLPHPVDFAVASAL